MEHTETSDVVRNGSAYLEYDFLTLSMERVRIMSMHGITELDTEIDTVNYPIVMLSKMPLSSFW